jgi:hypothetical protein
VNASTGDVPRPAAWRTALSLALALFLAWRAVDGARALTSHGSPPFSKTELLPGSDDELLRRALGRDWAPFAALRDRVPRDARVALVGKSAEYAGFYQRVETMLYPMRFAGVVPEAFATWAPPSEPPERDQYVLVYEDAAVARLERWFEAIDLGALAAGRECRLYVLRGREGASGAAATSREVELPGAAQSPPSDGR